MSKLNYQHANTSSTQPITIYQRIINPYSFYMCNMLGCIFVLAIHVLKHGFWVAMFSVELRVMWHPTLPMCEKGDMLI